MGRAKRYTGAAIVIGILALTLGAVFAATDLAGTSWSSPADTGCGMDLRFNSGGTATVFKREGMATHRDTAHWTQQGSEIHLTYDTWGGGLDGGFWEGGVMAGISVASIHATENYQDDTGASHARTCIFEQNK